MHTKIVNSKVVLYIVLGIFALVFTINWYVHGKTMDINYIKSSISLSVTVTTILSIIFCKYLWKKKIFRKWLVLIPNLNGSWEGKIETTWIDPKTNQKKEPIVVEMTIKQTLFYISCVMKTQEMRSNSINAGFNIISDNQIFQFIYTYMSIPKQNIQEHNRIHYGTIIFDMNDNFEVDKLEGNYWTNRETSGCITVKRK